MMTEVLKLEKIAVVRSVSRQAQDLISAPSHFQPLFSVKMLMNVQVKLIIVMLTLPVRMWLLMRVHWDLMVSLVNVMMAS